jgi:hypothetical protein
MAACSAWMYKNITPNVFKALQTVGRRKGFTIPGTPTGKFMINVSGFQVGFQYAWDPNSGTLLLTCVSKPMLLGCSTIKGFADKIIAESGGKVA